MCAPEVEAPGVARIAFVPSSTRPASMRQHSAITGTEHGGIAREQLSEARADWSNRGQLAITPYLTTSYRPARNSRRGSEERSSGSTTDRRRLVIRADEILAGGMVDADFSPNRRCRPCARSVVGTWGRPARHGERGCGEPRDALARRPRRPRRRSVVPRYWPPPRSGRRRCVPPGASCLKKRSPSGNGEKNRLQPLPQSAPSNGVGVQPPHGSGFEHDEAPARSTERVDDAGEARGRAAGDVDGIRTGKGHGTCNGGIQVVTEVQGVSSPQRFTRFKSCVTAVHRPYLVLRGERPKSRMVRIQDWTRAWSCTRTSSSSVAESQACVQPWSSAARGPCSS